MKLLQTITAGAGGQATFNFTSINQTYSDILLVVSARSDRASGLDQMNVTFNGSTTGYGNRQLLGFGSGAGYSETGGSTYVYNYGADGATATASTFGNTSLYISNYTSSNMKVISTQQVFETNAAGGWQGLASSSWSGTAAINQITVSPNYGTVWVQGSTASLYGINPIPTASLGAPTAVDYLVVAGGGGGGSSYGAGGGAGGMLTGTAFAVSPGSAITVTVGSGGAAGNPGANGNNSVFSTLTAIGGGRGGSSGSLTGGSGGSGGGGGASAGGLGTGGSGTSGQGYAGGNAAGPSYPNYGIGGGGGAGSAGGAATSGGVGGNAGNGAISTINGFSTYYAGGGAGNGYSGAGSAGTQGGVAQGVAAQPNTGSGGGGDGAAGGSGIVIIRYPQTYAAPTATTGNPAVNYINGYRVYTWYNSGSITF